MDSNANMRTLHVGSFNCVRNTAAWLYACVIHADGDGYSAIIAKSTDGGSTWKLIYNQTGKFYFNEIDCISDDICMVGGHVGMHVRAAN